MLCQPVGNNAAPPNVPTDTSFEKAILAECASCWQWRIDTDPELAAAIGMLEERRSEHALDPRSLDSFEARFKWVSGAKVRMETLLANGGVELSDGLQLTCDLYLAQLEDYVNNFKYRTFLSCINRLEGPQTDLPLYARYLPMNSASDWAFYSKFIEAIPQQIDENISLLKQGVVENRTPPQVCMGGVSDQVRGIVSKGPVAFTTPLEKITDANAKAAIMAKIPAVTAAFLKLADFLDKEYTPKLR